MPAVTAATMAGDLGPRPELAWLPVDRLEVDRSYQRSLDTPAGQKLIGRIAEGFQWARFQAILATPATAPGGVAVERWLIIDGQHRVAAARQVGLSLVPAVVIRAVDAAAQAAAFVGANRDRVPVSPQALFHARLAAGDGAALILRRLCDAAGIRLLPYPKARRSTPAGQTTAITHLLVVLDKYGEAIAGAAISTVADCFRDEPGGMPGLYFRAAGQYLSQGGDPDRLRAALRALGGAGLDRLAAKLNTNSALVAICGELRRRTGLVAGRAAAPRTAPAAPASPLPAGRIATAPAVRSVPAAAGPAAASLPDADAKRAEEQDQIARFLAAKGSVVVMSPEQVATFLRDCGQRAAVREVAEGQSWSAGPRPAQPVKAFLDDRPVALAVLYETANRLRDKAGLPPLRLPEDGPAGRAA